MHPRSYLKLGLAGLLRPAKSPSRGALNTYGVSAGLPEHACMFGGHTQGAFATLNSDLIHTPSLAY